MIFLFPNNPAMSRKYKFRNPDGIYFVTYSVIHWIDIFIRNEYKELLLDSWKFCTNEKGLDIYAWCIMTSHVHMIIGSRKEKLENIMRDMKRHTSTKMKKIINENPRESRKDWLLKMFQQAGLNNRNNNKFQFWQQNNHPLELSSNKDLENCINYIHYNPVKAGYVYRAEDYVFSSALDYAGGKGLIDIILIE